MCKLWTSRTYQNEQKVQSRLPHVQNPLWLETLPFGTDPDFPQLLVRCSTPVNGDWMLLARELPSLLPFGPLSDPCRTVANRTFCVRPRS
jgi:hypothetical protein